MDQGPEAEGDLEQAARLLCSKCPRPLLHVAYEFVSCMPLKLGSASLCKPVLLTLCVLSLCMAPLLGTAVAALASWKDIHRGRETGLSFSSFTM